MPSTPPPLPTAPSAFRYPPANGRRVRLRGYLGLYMLPWNRRRYRLPSALPGIVLLLMRSPFIVVMELARRVSPRIDRRWQRLNLERWERWLQWQSAGKAAAFEAATPLRR